MCGSETGGKLIHDILYREAKEILESMEDIDNGGWVINLSPTAPHTRPYDAP